MFLDTLPCLKTSKAEKQARCFFVLFDEGVTTPRFTTPAYGGGVLWQNGEDECDAETKQYSLHGLTSLSNEDNGP